jgi:hypothetical protein
MKDTSQQNSERACSRLSIVRFANGPKRLMGHVLGAEKGIFLIRDIDGPAMTAASVESCRFVVLRSLGGRSGSVLNTCNRLRRMRGRFHRWPTLSASHRAGAQVPKVFDPELLEELQESAHAA